MQKKIIDYVKKADGIFLAIGINDEKIISVLNSNSAIVEAFLLSNEKKSNNKNDNNYHKKNINIKKMRKRIKKNSIDYMLINYDEVKKYMKFIIRDSILINKKIICIYGNTDSYTQNKIQKKYKRYNTTIENDTIGDNFLMKIYTTNTKYSFLKNIGYRFIDFWDSLLDIIGDSLFN